MKLTKYDYEYLTGMWEGVAGAAFNVVAEDCMNAQLGYYGHPTEKGKKAIKEFEAEHVHYVKPISPEEATKRALEALRERAYTI